MATVYRVPHESIVGGSYEGSLCSSGVGDSWRSTYVSNSRSGSYEESRFSGVSASEIGPISESALSDCCSDEDEDLESGAVEITVQSAKVEKDCRICHLSLESPSQQELGGTMQLGCSCKDDLGAAHMQCAEVWFNIKGNRTCEICGAIARNVVTVSEPEIMEEPSETSNAVAVPQEETSSCWHGHRLFNCLLVCMVFGFVVSWIFHSHVPSRMT